MISQRVCAAFLLLLPLCAVAQKLKVDEKNGKSWNVETFPLSLKSSEDTKMEIALSASDTSVFLHLSGSGIGTSTLDVNNEVIFLLDNDTDARARSVSLQPIDYGSLLPTYRHHYQISYDDLEKLSRHNLHALRKYSLGGFDDISIEKKNESRVRDLARFFLGEIKKRKPVLEKPKAATAAFPGGKEVLLNFLNRNLKPITDAGNERREVAVQFNVTADGSIDDLFVKQSAGTAYDNELLRILNRMPKWKPAVEDGKKVNSVVIQKLVFYQSNGVLKIELVQ